MRARNIGNSARWRRWARSFAARVPVRRRGRIALELVLRPRPRSSLRVVITNRHSMAGGATVLVQPRIHLALHPRFERTWVMPRPGLRPHAGPGRGLRAATVTGATGSVARLLRREHSERHVRRLESSDHRETRTLVRQVIDRTRRVEKRLASRPLVVARSVAASTARQADPVLPSGRPDRDWWAQAAAPSTAERQRIGASTVNVEQLTEHVLRQLDQRVSAWRERTGRA